MKVLRPDRRRLLRLCSHGLLLAGSAALGYYTFVWAEGRWTQAYQSRELDRAMEHAQVLPASRGLASGTPGSLRPRALVGRLEVPRIGLSVMVLEGDDARTLRVAAGHIPGTALPGQPGNVGIAAHRDTFFRKLQAVRQNDLIRLKTPTGIYRYGVESVRVVEPEDTQVLAATAYPALTLVTCFPFHYIGPAPQRFIVRARQLTAAGLRRDNALFVRELQDRPRL